MIREMKAVVEVESGLLPTFRLFIGIQLVLTALRVASLRVASTFYPAELVTPPAVFSILEPVLLLLYLSVPGLRRRLGAFYLPIGIVWAAVGPTIEPYLEFAAREVVPENYLLFALWRQINLLFIPLIVVSWQYSMRQVILFCALTIALNIALMSQTVSLQLLTSGFVLGTLGMQMVVFLLVGNMLVNLLRIQREQRRRLAQHASTLEQLTISRERNRLARELHDTLAHSLSGVAVQLEAVDALWNTSSDEAHGMLRQSLVTTRSGLTETRRALQALRPSPLEDLGLALALRGLSETVAARGDLKLELDVPEGLKNLPPEVEEGIYRIAQEALENVAKHAHAKSVRVQLSQDDNRLALTISDDGQGFDPKNIDPVRQFGIQGMRERTEMLGGTLEVDSQPERGTVIQLAWSRSI